MGKRSKREREEAEAERPGEQCCKEGAPRKEKKAKKDRKDKKRRDGGQGDEPEQPAAAAAQPPPAADSSDESEQPDMQLDPQPAAGSHDADAAAAEQQQQEQQTAGGGDGAERRKREGGKPAPVLPWMRVPIAIEASEGVLLEEVQGLDPRLKSALEGTRVEVLFPVQAVVWHETAGGVSPAHDVCICAPTGSGKTLSYALPVLAALAGRAAPALRALCVLPTRDLAGQVFSVLAGLCPALGLTAALAAGRASLAAEAELLAGGDVDILVATPGRLIAHLEGTPGFSLSALRFLVVDETDRLLRQAYQGWLPKVMAALESKGGGGGSGGSSGGGSGAGAGAAADQQGLPEQQQQPQPQQQPRRVVKFVVSATLTRDPSKIARLGLHCPRYIAMSAVDHRYKLPRSLTERKLVVPAERKPAALVALLQELRGESTIVFTSSVEATHRLYLLLAALPPACLPPRAAVEFSSLVPPPERAANLEAFRRGDAKVLVCSDAMTRGMDVAGVQNVVNYDAPVYVKTYVHRAGRTARAGAAGRVVTLLRHEDVRHFRGMLRKADNAFVGDHRLGKGALEAVRDDVDAALEVMAARLLAEQAAQGQQQQPRQQAAAAGSKEKQAAGGEKKPAAKAARRRRLANVPEWSLL